MRKKLLFTVAEVWPKVFYRFLHIQILVAFMLLYMAQAIAKPFTINKISVEFNQAVLSQALHDVEQKSGYHFTFSDNSSMKNFKVSLKANDMDVLQVVERLLVNTGMSYEQFNDTVTAINQVTNDRVFAQISGDNAAGEPLVAVSDTDDSKVPGVVKPASVSSQPVIGEDFFLTILQMAGISNYKTIGPIDGKSCMPNLINSGYSDTLRTFTWHFPNKWQPEDGPGINYKSAIRQGNLKLIYNMRNGSKELYNLARDLGENNDVSIINYIPQKCPRLASFFLII